MGCGGGVESTRPLSTRDGAHVLHLYCPAELMMRTRTSTPQFVNHQSPLRQALLSFCVPYSCSLPLTTSNEYITDHCASVWINHCIFCLFVGKMNNLDFITLRVIRAVAAFVIGVAGTSIAKLVSFPEAHSSRFTEDKTLHDRAAFTRF